MELDRNKKEEDLADGFMSKNGMKSFDLSRDWMSSFITACQT